MSLWDKMLKGSDVIKEIYDSDLTYNARHHFTVIFLSLLKFEALFSMNHLHYPLSHLTYN